MADGTKEWYDSILNITPVLVLQASTTNGPFTRYAILRVAHAPGMPGTFSLPLRVSNPGMHDGTCMMHMPLCMPGLLTSGLLWSQWWGKRSQHSRRLHNLQFYVSETQVYTMCINPRVLCQLPAKYVGRKSYHCNHVKSVFWCDWSMGDQTRDFAIWKRNSPICDLSWKFHCTEKVAQYASKPDTFINI